MPLKEKRAIILYPEYFSIGNTRGSGRRVPKKLAFKSPTIDDISKAVKSLGLKATVEGEKAYPRYWWKRRGRVIVETDMPKTQLLRKVADKLPKK